MSLTVCKQAPPVADIDARGGAHTMSRMLLMSKSLRIFLTEEYSLQSSGSPNALLASTVSKPSSCKPRHHPKSS